MGTARTSSARFVGRQQELTRLTELLDQAADGRPSCALVTGEAGIGKTRLVRELAQCASARGADVLVGSCVDLPDDVLPYAPFVEVLSDLLRRDGAGSLLTLAGPTGDELSRLLPVLGAGAPAEPSTGSAARLLLAVESILEGLAASRPVLLVVEDVQWADASTRDLLVLLAHQTRGRVLVVVTFRTHEVAGSRSGGQHLLARLERVAARMDLPPLTRVDQAHQLSSILGVPPTSALLDRVYGRAEGNPFFAEELLALGPDEAVPATVRELLLARLHELPPATQQALRAAAAAGRRVSHTLLDAVADMHGSALEDALRCAVDRDVLVVEPADRRYSFRHALLHEAVSSTLLPGEAERLHRRLAQALTADPTLAADAPHAVTGRVALHWQAAGDPSSTLTTSVTAAGEAEQALAFAEAHRHYERAISLVDQVPAVDALLPVPRYRLLWSAAEAAHLAAHPDRAAALARAAIDAVDALDGANAHHAAYLHERLGRYLWMAAEGDGALREYERAVELCPDDVSCWRAAILSGYSQILMLSGRFAEARTWAEEAIRLSALVDDGRSTEGHARNNLGVSLAMLGEVDAGVQELLLARRIAEEELDDVDDVARAIVNLHSVLFDAGRLQESADVSLDGIAVVDRLGLQRRKGVWCRCDAAESLTLLGRPSEARRLMDEAVAAAPQGVDAVRVDSVLGQVVLRSGQAAAAVHLLTAARESGGRVRDGHLNGPLLAALVEALRWTGQPQVALTTAWEVLPRLQVDGDGPYAVPFLAEAIGAAADAAVLGSRRRAAERAQALAQAEELARLAAGSVAQMPAVLPPTAASLLLAESELARARGDADPVRWRKTAAAWDVIGDRYRVAYAQWREAEAHVAAGSVRAAATAAATAALRTAADIGAEHLQEAVEELIRRTRLPAPARGEVPAPDDPFRLTRREREVLELVAQGRTDRQIGEHLFISHRTVERHVSNLLAKADARTRAELAAVAHRTGLVTVR